jgi:ribosomal protein L11 methylase PrmA
LNGQFDLVVANILANPLKVLAPAISAHVRRVAALPCPAFSSNRRTS